jgi:hypothetical protein
MARRGQCRCGLILTFHRTAQGYKMRCPSCGSVVRLRVKGKKRRRPRPDTATIHPPADEFDVELVSPSEMARSAPRPPRRGMFWLLVAGGGAALLALLAAAGGLVWWFW